MLRWFCYARFGYCSAEWYSAADIYLNLLDRVVNGACFLTGGGLDCDLTHLRFVAVLCMLDKIRCNPMHPLCGALPVPYVRARVTLGVLVAHRYTYAPPRCRTSQYHRSFIPLSVSLWNDFADSVFDGVGLAGFKSRANALLFAYLLVPFLVFFCFPFLFFFSIGWYCRSGVFALIRH